MKYKLAFHRPDLLSPNHIRFLTRSVKNNVMHLYKTQNMTLLKLQRDESDSRSKTQAVSFPR